MNLFIVVRTVVIATVLHHVTVNGTYQHAKNDRIRKSQQYDHRRISPPKTIFQQSTHGIPDDRHSEGNWNQNHPLGSRSKHDVPRGGQNGYYGNPKEHFFDKGLPMWHVDKGFIGLGHVAAFHPSHDFNKKYKHFDKQEYGENVYAWQDGHGIGTKSKITDKDVYGQYGFKKSVKGFGYGGHALNRDDVAHFVHGFRNVDANLNHPKKNGYYGKGFNVGKYSNRKYQSKHGHRGYPLVLRLHSNYLMEHDGSVTVIDPFIENQHNSIVGHPLQVHDNRGNDFEGHYQNGGALRKPWSNLDSGHPGNGKKHNKAKPNVVTLTHYKRYNEQSKPKVVTRHKNDVTNTQKPFVVLVVSPERERGYVQSEPAKTRSQSVSENNKNKSAQPRQERVTEGKIVPIEKITMETAEHFESNLAPIRVPTLLVDDPFPCSAPLTIACGATRPWSHVIGMDYWCRHNCPWEIHKGGCDLARCRCRCVDTAV